jgi:hypothetical protein
MENISAKIGFLPVCPFEVKLPELQLAAVERDKRLDVITNCEYTENNETYD